MAAVKTYKKTVNGPRKQAIKKAKPKKGSLEAVDKAMEILRKNNVDLTFIIR
jgi:hypothetical protein